MDSCDISERAALTGTSSAHEAAGRIGALPSWLRPIDLAMKCRGPALTVRVPKGDNLWIHKALLEVRRGEVLVVETGRDGADFGYWGEIMATAAITAGAAGLIITAGVRDVEALIGLGLPTFSRTITMQGTVKDPEGDGSVGDPVRIGDVTIRRGDFIMADADGVLALPAALAEAVVEKAIERDAKEGDVLRLIREGATTFDVYRF